MVEAFQTGFVFSVGFMCGSVGCLLLGGKLLEFFRVALIRVRFVRPRIVRGVADRRPVVSPVQNVPTPPQQESEVIFD